MTEDTLTAESLENHSEETEFLNWELGTVGHYRL